MAVVIPTRYDSGQDERLERAIYTIKGQEACSSCFLTVYLGLDPSSAMPACTESTDCRVIPIEAKQASQASALNACIQASSEDLIMFLEDDDFWEPDYLGLILNIFSKNEEVDIVTSNQLEVDQFGSAIRVNDFPTPSTWSLTRASLDKLGLFNEEYHYHLDNEYLGRSSSIGLIRFHLLERIAPIRPEEARLVRPWIYNVMTQSGGSTRFFRHNRDTPFIIRTVRESSRSGEVKDLDAKERSRLEYNKLVDTYGRVPW